MEYEKEEQKAKNGTSMVLPIRRGGVPYSCIMMNVEINYTIFSI